MRLLRQIVVALLFSAASAGPAFADCNLQSQNIDYCGPANNHVMALAIPDRLFGPFAAACEGHDYCYFKAGNTLVKAMEQAFLKSMSSASAAEKAPFSSRRDDLKSQCDSQFLRALSRSCRTLSAIRRPLCTEAAGAYFFAVVRGGGDAFDQAWDKAFLCRF